MCEKIHASAAEVNNDIIVYICFTSVFILEIKRWKLQWFDFRLSHKQGQGHMQNMSTAEDNEVTNGSCSILGCNVTRDVV